MKHNTIYLDEYADYPYSIIVRTGDPDTIRSSKFYSFESLEEMSKLYDALGEALHKPYVDINDRDDRYGGEE